MDIQKIRENQKLDTVLLFAPEEILAAADIDVQKSCLVVDEAGLTLICPEGEEGLTLICPEGEEGLAPIGPEGAKGGLRCLTYAEVGFERVERAKENFWERIRQRISGRGRIGVNFYSCPMAFLEGRERNTEYRDISGEITEAMMVKKAFFFEKYEAVAELNRRAYERIRETIHSGCSEQEIAKKVRQAYVGHAQSQVLYGGDFLSGDRTLKIAGPPTERAIRAGETVIVDIQCTQKGAGCDTTRSFFCQEPTKEQEQVYRFLTAVLQETAGLLKPGVLAGDIYRHINRRFMEEGYGGLVHHGGHGLGYRWYEAPYFIDSCDMVLKEDMLVALEPGIYLPDQFGLRIENNYRVTAAGGVDVFDYKTKLEDFIIG